MKKEKKKEYLPAELKLTEFDATDVICTSGKLDHIDPEDNSWV